jgi:hypothetical protein
VLARIEGGEHAHRHRDQPEHEMAVPDRPMAVSARGARRLRVPRRPELVSLPSPHPLCHGSPLLLAGVTAHRRDDGSADRAPGPARRRSRRSGRPQPRARDVPSFIGRGGRRVGRRDPFPTAFGTTAPFGATVVPFRIRRRVHRGAARPGDHPPARRRRVVDSRSRSGADPSAQADGVLRSALGVATTSSKPTATTATASSKRSARMRSSEPCAIIFHAAAKRGGIEPPARIVRCGVRVTAERRGGARPRGRRRRSAW